MRAGSPLGRGEGPSRGRGRNSGGRRLAFQIERRFEGYIDAYIGPAEFRAEVMAEPEAPIAELEQRGPSDLRPQHAFL